MLIIRSKKWLKLATEYIGSQISVKAMSAIGALLLINMLSIQEYAIYTLLLATFTFVNSFSDFGATGSLLYFWRRTKSRINLFALYLHAVFRLRKILFISSAILGFIYLVIIIYLKDHDRFELIIGSIIMMLASWYTVTAGTWVFVLRIIGNFRQSYVVESLGELTKLAIVLMLWITKFTFSWAAMGSILAGAFVSAKIASAFSKRIEITHTRTSERAIHYSNRAVWKQTIPTIPWSLFFTIQGPLVVWLAATFGSINNLAQVGALGRIGAIIALVSGFSISVFVPKLSNIIENGKFIKYYIVWNLFLCIFGFCFMLIIKFYPEGLLALLGNQYTNLNSELIIVATTSIITTFEYFFGAINRMRGWVHGQMWRISFIIFGQLLILPFMNFNSTKDLLLFGLATAILAMIVQFGFNVAGFLNILKK